MSEKFFSKKPNIIVFLTDQQRELRDFPPTWVEQNLKSLNRLKKNGVTFTNSYINTAPCWSNRGVIMSGLYPLVNQVVAVGDTLSPNLSNFAAVLKKAGYRAVYKGKWHLTEKSDVFASQYTTDSNSAQIAVAEDLWMKNLYGLEGWTSPDAGTSLVMGSHITSSGVSNLGGGKGANDNRVITGAGLLAPQEQESVLDFIKNNRSSEQPWCLFVCLVNPHDISVYPATESQLEEAGYSLSDIESYEGFELPESYYKDDLKTKPDAQLNFLRGFDNGGMDEETALNYLKFYAYMTALSDQLIGEVLDIMTDEQIDETLIIRTADHGEMGAAHGGLREKMNTFYQETVKVPLIFSNPILYPEGRVCEELVGQIDLLPTIGEMLGFDDQTLKSDFYLQGASFAKALSDPHAKTANEQLFLFYSGDDYKLVRPSGEANIICGIVTKRWKYGVYFAPTNGTPSKESYPGITTGKTFRESPPEANQESGPDEDVTIVTANWVPVVDLTSVQYELYDLEVDPNELTNLAEESAPEIKEAWTLLHRRLTRLMMENNSMPVGWLDIVV